MIIVASESEERTTLGGGCFFFCFRVTRLIGRRNSSSIFSIDGVLTCNRDDDRVDMIGEIFGVSQSLKSEYFLNKQCEDIDDRMILLTVSVQVDLMMNISSDIRERVRTYRSTDRKKNERMHFLNGYVHH